MNASPPPLPFPRCYDKSRPTRITYRNLPHWEQDGVCAFVTIRLADSIPDSVRTTLDRKRERWLKERGFDPTLPTAFLLDRMDLHTRRGFCRFNSSLLHRALDKGHGDCVLRNRDLRWHVEDCLQFGNGDSYDLFAYVVMPNHAHLLIQPKTGERIKDHLSTIRRVSARRINRDLGRQGDLWQCEPFDHLIRSRHWFQRYRDYLRLNPYRARLRPEAYTHWEHPVLKLFGGVRRE